MRNLTGVTCRCAAALLIVGMWALASHVAYCQTQPSVVTVSGKAVDEAGKPLENVIIRVVGSDVSPVLSNAQGEYKFFLVGQEGSFTLTAEKEGYTAAKSQPMTPSKDVKYDPVLTQGGAVSVSMDKFESGIAITGKVTGLPAGEAKQYKVVIYVLTNKWFIHPLATNVDGEGYASITDDGTWRIQTANRHNGPFKLAMLVVAQSVMPPANVEMSQSGEGDADQALLAKFAGKLKAFKIVTPAPEGL